MSSRRVRTRKPTTRHRGTVIAAAVALGALATAGCGASGSLDTGSPTAAAATAEEPEVRTGGITVEAVGTVEGTPDVLTAVIGVRVEGRSVGEVYDNANAAAAEVRDALVDVGVETADIRTAQISLNAYTGSRDDRPPYVASNQLRVQLRDVASAGDTIDAAVDAGGEHVTIRSVGFSLDDDNELLVAAREAAYAEARAKAEQYAELSGRPLGQLVGLAEGSDVYGPLPEMDRYLDADAAADGLVVEPGTELVQIRIRATWSLG